MNRRIPAGYIACALILCLSFVSLAAASPRTDKRRESVEKVRTGILSLGTGPDARVEVTLRDKTKLAGYISAAGDENFVVNDSRSGAERTIPYDDVAKVKGNNWSTKKTITITAVIVGALAIIYFAFFHGKHL